MFGRSGAVAVAALLLVPLTALASRRRWAAYVVGGSLAIFAITLVPWLFTPFADVVSLSQARRLAGFLPVRRSRSRAAWRCSRRSSARSRLRSRSPPGSSCSGSSPATSATRSSREGRRGRRGSPSQGAVVALVLGLRAAALAGGAEPPSPRRCCSCRRIVHGLSDWSPSSARPAEPAHARARRGASNDGSRRRDRLLRPRVELPDRRRRPGLHLQRAARPRRRHDAGTIPTCAATSGAASTAPATSAIPRRCGATWLVIDRASVRHAAAASRRLPRRSLHALPPGRTIGCHSMTRARTPLLVGLVTAAVLLASAAAVDGLRSRARGIATSRSIRGTSAFGARRAHPLPRLLLRVPAGRSRGDRGAGNREPVRPRLRQPASRR